MSDHPNVYGTGKLTSGDLESALHALPRFLEDRFGNRLVKVYYGFSSGLHPQLWYSPMDVRTSGLPTFIEGSIRQEIYRPGESDLIIELPEAGFEILLGHEGDIQTRGTDMEAQKALWSRLPYAAFPLLRRPA